MLTFNNKRVKMKRLFLTLLIWENNLPSSLAITRVLSNTCPPLIYLVTLTELQC